MAKIDRLFLSVGAMKAGTTWLYEQLRFHPDLYFTPEKEIHYLANVMGIENQLNQKRRIEKLKDCLKRYHKGNLKFIAKNVEEICWYTEYARPGKISNDWYEDLFRFSEQGQYCCDFSNLYCQMDSGGWSNARKLTSKVKVIYTLRDPLKRLWSHYKFHMKWVNREDEALKVGTEHFKALLDKPWFWVNAEYAKNYQTLRQCLVEDELLLLYFECFRENPERELSRVQQFLGIQQIASNEEGLNQKVNKTKEFDLPEHWLHHMQDKLRPLTDDMKEQGLWHQSWTECL